MIGQSLTRAVVDLQDGFEYGECKEHMRVLWKTL